MTGTDEESLAACIKLYLNLQMADYSQRGALDQENTFQHKEFSVLNSLMLASVALFQSLIVPSGWYRLCSSTLCATLFLHIGS